METRNVNLTRQLNAFIDESVASGQYQNASELVREGLRLVQQRHKEDAAKLERLMAAITIGEDAIARGDYIELEAGEIGDWVASLRRERKE